MRLHNTRRTLFATLAATLLLGAGAPVLQAGETVHSGPPVRVGNGHARVAVAVDATGHPAAVSVILERSALQGLPAATAEQHEWDYVLPLPPAAPDTGYEHVLLNWNPAGHPPAGVYSVPHFDVHFYLIGEAERQAITFQGAEGERARTAPDARLVPAGYVIPPDTAVERMGLHGLDPNGPEFRGEGFSHTFIYGYHAARLIFVEPMVSVDFLRSGEDMERPVATLETYSLPGHYPTRYRIGVDPDSGAHIIALLGLRAYPTVRSASR